MSIVAKPTVESEAAAKPVPVLLWPWIHVGVAAAAMVATLPGRTHGLGLITEPLLADLRIARVDYGLLNLWATLLGAAFCIPFGWLLDRWGVRTVLTATLALLGGVVVAMSQIRADWSFSGESLSKSLLVLFLAVLLTRGLGQSGLSVVSLALVGKSVGRRSGPAIGVYSFLVAAGFMGAFALSKHALEHNIDWRTVWASIGMAVAALAPVGWLLVRQPSLFTGGTSGASTKGAATSFTLMQALKTPAFWVFALAPASYLLITSGLSLFNQSILAERGFDRSVFLTLTMISPFFGLAANLGGGWLALHWPMKRLLAVAMVALAAALAQFPYVTTLPQVYAYAIALALAGGLVTVVFFGIWAQTFGTACLGQIQGMAQMATVLASAVGPLLFAATQKTAGSYVPLFGYAALTAGLLGVASWWVPLPQPPRPSLSINPRSED